MDFACGLSFSSAGSATNRAFPYSFYHKHLPASMVDSLKAPLLALLLNILPVGRQEAGGGGRQAPLPPFFRHDTGRGGRHAPLPPFSRQEAGGGGRSTPSPLPSERRHMKEAEDQLLPLPHYSLSSSRLHAEEAEKEEQKPSEIERSPETTMHLLSLTDIFLVSFRLIGRLTVS